MRAEVGQFGGRSSRVGTLRWAGAFGAECMWEFFVGIANDDL